MFFLTTVLGVIQFFSYTLRIKTVASLLWRIEAKLHLLLILCKTQQGLNIDILHSTLQTVTV